MSTSSADIEAKKVKSGYAKGGSEKTKSGEVGTDALNPIGKLKKPDIIHTKLLFSS